MRRGLRAVSRTKQDFALQSIASPRNQSNQCIMIIGRFRKVPLSPNRNRLQFTEPSQWPDLRANPASLGRTPVPQPDCLRGVWFPSWPVRRHSSSSGSKRDAYSIEAAAVLGIHPKTLQRMARSGQIRGIRVGKLWRFRRSEIDMWIERKLAS